MNRSRVILILEPEGDEGIRILDAINEVRAPLDHPLIDQLAEGFILYDQPKVIDEFVPETAIDEVTCGVLCTADVEVDMAPVGILLTTHQSLIVVWVHIAEVVG